MSQPANFASIVAANVTALRKERGLTVSAAAQLVGVSPRTWAYFEKPCDSSPGASIGSNIDRICAAFQVPLADLLTIPKAQLGFVPPVRSAREGRNPKENPMIACACGCGKKIRQFDENGRARTHAAGHRKVNRFAMKR